MDGQHTPGPWTHEFLNVRRETPNGFSQMVAKAHSEDVYGSDEARSNARLIAAAPELLEALQNLVIAIGMGWDLDGMVSVADEAIAKAIGRSP